MALIYFESIQTAEKYQIKIMDSAATGGLAFLCILESLEQNILDARVVNGNYFRIHNVQHAYRQLYQQFGE